MIEAPAPATIDQRTPEEIREAEFQGRIAFLGDVQTHVFATSPEASPIGLPDDTDVWWLFTPEVTVVDGRRKLLGIEMRNGHDAYIVTGDYAEHRPDFDRKRTTTGKTALAEANTKLKEILNRQERARAAQAAGQPSQPTSIDFQPEILEMFHL
jgi:hypothetical protein